MAEERIAVLEEAIYGQHEPEEEQEEEDPAEPEELEEDLEEDPEEAEEPTEAAEPEEPAVTAPRMLVPVAPVPGHQDQFARMPAHFQVYSRWEHRRGCGGYLIDYVHLGLG